MIEEIKKIKGNKRELRQFGLIIGGVLGIVGAILYFLGKDLNLYILGLSMLLIFLAILMPFLLRQIYKLWMILSICSGWVMTRFILIILFYGVITPTGLIMRIFKKDFLNINFESKTKSYWISKSDSRLDDSSCENQY